jgi:hypothetical protein
MAKNAKSRQQLSNRKQPQGGDFAEVISFPSPVSEPSDPLSHKCLVRIRELQKYIKMKRLELDESLKEEQRELDELKREAMRALESGAPQECIGLQAKIVERVKIATRAHRFKKIVKHLVIE